MPVDGLEQPCGACGRISGDHTLREWAACIGQGGTYLAPERIPDDLQEASQTAFRERFMLDEDVIIADHVVVRSATLGGDSDVITFSIPVLMHEFQVGTPGLPPTTVAKVLFLAGEADGCRKYGELVSQSAELAAKSVEGR